MSLSSTITLKKVVPSRRDASEYLQAAGDAVLVERGVPRWLLLSCPCGCGAEIPINLDSRAGPAWRLYSNQRLGLSVYPSVWRDTDCGSHFIIWRNRILLFDRGDDDYRSPIRTEEVATLATAVLKQMPATGSVSYVTLAHALQEIPWDVLEACKSLVRGGIMREGTGDQRGSFGRLP